MLRKQEILTFNRLALLLSMLFLFSCDSDSGNFDFTDIVTQKDSIVLSIETQPDGNGQRLTDVAIFDQESVSLFAVLRDSNSGDYLSATSVDWVTSGVSGSLSENQSHYTTFSAELPGSSSESGSISASYPLLNLTVAATIKVLPKLDTDNSLIAWYSADVGVTTRTDGQISSVLNQSTSSRAIGDLSGIWGYGRPVLAEADQSNPYPRMQFAGREALDSSRSTGIIGNDERTVIAVFETNYFDYIPDVPGILGFGGSSNGSVFDFNIYGGGELFVNFLGPYDDTLDEGAGGSPLVSLNTIHVGTSVYDGTDCSVYLDGEFGNSVQYDLQTSNSKLNVGIGAFTDGNYVNGYDGNIYEIMIFDRKLSSEELDGLHRYLLGKYQ